MLMLIAAAPLGIIAICISQIIYAQIAVFINTYYTKKYFDLGWLSQVRDFSKYLIMSIVACLPIYLLVLLNFPNLIILFGGPIIATFVYSFILLPNDSVFIELKCIVKDNITRLVNVRF